MAGSRQARAAAAPTRRKRDDDIFFWTMCTARGSVTIVGERPPARTPYIGQEGDSIFEDNDF